MGGEQAVDIARVRIEELSVPEQWDRHRAQHPEHTATLTDGHPIYRIFCNDCLWHDYGNPSTRPAGGDS